MSHGSLSLGVERRLLFLPRALSQAVPYSELRRRLGRRVGTWSHGHSLSHTLLSPTARHLSVSTTDAQVT